MKPFMFFRVFHKVYVKKWLPVIKCLLVKHDERRTSEKITEKFKTFHRRI